VVQESRGSRVGPKIVRGENARNYRSSISESSVNAVRRLEFHNVVARDHMFGVLTSMFTPSLRQIDPSFVLIAISHPRQGFTLVSQALNDAGMSE